MPPSNTTGKVKGNKPRQTMPAHCARGTGASRGMLRCLAIQATTAIIKKAINKPGTTPPKNKAPTDAPETRAITARVKELEAQGFEYEAAEASLRSEGRRVRL